MRSDDDDLERLFAAARTAAPHPAEALLARVIADAEALQPRAAAPRPAPRAAGGFWSGLAAALGGRATLAGLTTATLAGVWIGFAQPTPLPVLRDTAMVEGFDIVELIPDLEAMMPEFFEAEG